MTMPSHVSRLCRSQSFVVFKVSRIGKLSNQSTTLKLIHAFVTSRMDYCHSLLFGLPSREIRKILIIANCAARHVNKT